jgi:hypothetical protein
VEQRHVHGLRGANCVLDTFIDKLFNNTQNSIFIGVKGMASLEDFGAYLVLRGEIDSASAFLHRLVEEGLDPILVSPDSIPITSDAEMTVLEPDQEERDIKTDCLITLLRELTYHLRQGEGKAVVICGLKTLREGKEFHDITNFVGRLYEEACVNRGLVLIFADPKDFTKQEMAFLEKEMVLLNEPEQLFGAVPSETVK